MWEKKTRINWRKISTKVKPDFPFLLPPSPPLPISSFLFVVLEFQIRAYC
jgi:hypothetical protein